MTAHLCARSGRGRLLGILLLASFALLAGCHNRRDAKNVTAAALYATAHKALVGNDFEYAIKEYEALTSRFPFANETRQARLDLIYAYYRKGDKDAATDAADQFLRENPTHPRVDYAQYMKGLINFERTPYAVERWLGVDMARRPPTDALKAITAFNIVATQYPKSEYAHDALRRLIYLRNRLAEYDVNVARYYVKRGAYMAAARRAEEVIEQYDGAPTEREAIAIMADCYRRLGFKDLAGNVDRIYQTNYPNQPESGSTSTKRWWTFWR